MHAKAAGRTLGFEIPEEFLASEIQCNRDKLIEALKPVIERDLLPHLHALPPGDLWLSIAGTPDNWTFTPEAQYVKPYDEHVPSIYCQACEFIHIPPVWVGAAPEWFDKRESNPEVCSLDQLADEVFRKELKPGVRFNATRDGIFRFDFTSWPDGCLMSDLDRGRPPSKQEVKDSQFKREMVLNAFLTCLYSAQTELQSGFVRHMWVAGRDVATRLSLDSSGGSGQVSEYFRSCRYRRTYQEGLPIWLDSRLADRITVVTVETLERASELLERLLEIGLTRGIERVDYMHQARQALWEGRYSLCLTLNWAVIESLVNQIWKAWYQAQDRDLEESEKKNNDEKFLSKDRKGTLDGKDFTNSIVSEILSLNGLITWEHYRDLKRVRSARNSFLHTLEAVAEEAALLSVGLAEKLFEHVEQVRFRVPAAGRGYSMFSMQDPRYEVFGLTAPLGVELRYTLILGHGEKGFTYTRMLQGEIVAQGLIRDMIKNWKLTKPEDLIKDDSYLTLLEEAFPNTTLIALDPSVPAWTQPPE